MVGLIRSKRNLMTPIVPTSNKHICLDLIKRKTDNLLIYFSCHENTITLKCGHLKSIDEKEKQPG